MLLIMLARIATSLCLATRHDRMNTLVGPVAVLRGAFALELAVRGSTNEDKAS